MKTIFKEAHWLSYFANKNSTRRPANYFWHKFHLEKSVKGAELRYAVIGIVEPLINGVQVHKDFFTPGWSDYRKRAYISNYDVSKLLREGENNICLTLADGWAGVPYGPKVHKVKYAPQTIFIAELMVHYKDGSSELISSNNEWKYRRGPVVHQSLYDGETYDARKEIYGDTPKELSSRSWHKATCVTAPKIKLELKKCPPVRVTETLKAIKLHRLRKKWIVDFGQNIAGVVCIRLRDTKRGQKIVLRFAEMLKKDGSLYRDNLRDARVTDVYYSKGSKEETFMPRFTFHGFRYVEIEGYEALEIQDLTACVMHNDLKKIGNLKIAHAQVQKLQNCIVWGQRGNFLEVPTDCPQRDERLGWSGDAQVFVNTACFNYDCEGFYRQWMDAMRDGQRKDGAFPDTAPDVLGSHGNAGWGDAGIIVPHAVWQNYGDLKIVQENWKAMEGYIDFLLARSDDYIQPPSVYGDWLAVDAARPEWSPTPKDLIGTAYFAYDCKLMADMAKALKMPERQAHYKNLYKKIKNAFQDRFMTKSGHILGNTQTSYLLALRFGLVPENFFDLVGEHLLKTIEDRDWHLSTGFLGTPHLNPVLTMIGRCDVAYRLLLEESYPSWLYSVKNGATTMWERWNSWTKEGGFGPVEMNSFNHYAYGAIGEWLYQRLAGIAPHPDFPGYERAIIAPLPNGIISNCRASLKTKSGTFHIEWQVQCSNFIIKLKVPTNTDALLRLPALSWNQISLNGKPVPERNIQVSTSRFGKCELLIGKGDYTFAIKTIL